MDAEKLQKKYRDLIEKDLMRFWEKAFDTERGGVFTCFTNDGSRLISTDKYVWSQGRMLWVLSRLCEMCGRGLVSIDRAGYERQAEKTFRLIADHALLGDGGVCAYLLDRDGNKKESISGKGFYTSYFVDCFVIMGMMEYARVFGKSDAAELGLRLFDKMMTYLGRGEIRSEPYPVKKGFAPHSESMILCNVCCVARDALRKLGHPRAEEFAEAAKRHMKKILFGFYDPKLGLIREMVDRSGAFGNSVLERHIAPGHCNECMWFCMDAVEDGDAAILERIDRIVEKNMAVGWDREYGGVYRFLDRDGNAPHGGRSGDPYEDLILDTWDTKLWWVHAETLYTTLRCYLRTGKPAFGGWYRRTEEYVFRHFPNPNREIGEWIQILDRQGRPLDKVVALPVKDPYHILRDTMLIVELLEKYRTPAHGIFG